MKKYNSGVVILLLGICIVAVVGGYMGSKSFPIGPIAFANMDAGSSGMVIPQDLITSEVEDILLKTAQEYPDNVTFTDNEVTLAGSDTVNSFKQLVSENNVDFDMNAVYSFYCLDTASISSDSHVAYFPGSYDSVTISYDDLERLLSGDNETVSYYRELLNNSQSDVYHGENAPVVVITEGYSHNSSNQANGAVFVAINSGE
jgi:hypothetical protein